MKLKYALALAAIACVAVAALAFGRGAQAQEGSPTAGAMLADGLSATGSAVGPDGALYIPQGGTGGDEVITVPPDLGITEEVTFGLTASIVRVDPETGAVTTEADELPSLAFDGEGGSIADVEFLGDDLFFLVTGSAAELGVEEWPNGVYRVDVDGSGAELFADISAFNADNPVDFPDQIPGGNPFALERRGSGFVVSDGNWNRIYSIDAGGDISILSSFENVVPTGLASDSSGPVLNTWFSAAPHLPGDSHVVSLAVPGGAVTQLASGPASMIDVTFGPDGRIFVLQFSDYTEDESAPPSPTGRIYELEGTTLSLLVDGFVLPTSLNFDGDTAYVTSLTGQVWQIEGFAALEPLPEPTAVPTTAPPPPAPTATPGTGVTAPDTGSGGNLDSDGSSPWLLALVAAMAVLGLGSVVFAVKRA